MGESQHASSVLGWHVEYYVYTYIRILYNLFFVPQNLWWNNKMNRGIIERISWISEIFRNAAQKRFFLVRPESWPQNLKQAFVTCQTWLSLHLSVHNCRINSNKKSGTTGYQWIKIEWNEGIKGLMMMTMDDDDESPTPPFLPFLPFLPPC